MAPGCEGKAALPALPTLLPGVPLLPAGPSPLVASLLPFFILFRSLAYLCLLGRVGNFFFLTTGHLLALLWARQPASLGEAVSLSFR